MVLKRYSETVNEETTTPLQSQKRVLDRFHLHDDIKNNRIGNHVIWLLGKTL